jgi:hypothetical protein
LAWARIAASTSSRLIILRPPGARPGVAGDSGPGTGVDFLGATPHKLWSTCMSGTYSGSLYLSYPVLAGRGSGCEKVEAVGVTLGAG